jgi:hypothetical protein
LSICVEHDLEPVVWDIKGAYMQTFMSRSGVYVKLNPEIAAEMLKVKPQWSEFLKKDGSMLVEAIKAWYGTEPAAALWNVDINETIVQQCGYTAHSMCKCIYFKYVDDRINILLLHVDDIFGMFQRLCKEMERVRRILEAKYGIMKKQESKVFTYLGMGMTFNRSEKRMEVDMIDFIEKVALRYEITTGVKNPNSSKEQDDYEGEDAMAADVTEYRSIVGIIRYIAMLTKCMSMFAVQVLGTRQVNPLRGDYKACVKVLRYQYGARHKKIHIYGYGKDRTMHWWEDASFATYPDGKSAECICMHLGESRALVFFGSWKQKVIASSVGNSEAICLSKAIVYGRYFRDVLAELGDNFKFGMRYYEDNQSCIDLVTGSGKSNQRKEKFMLVRLAVMTEYFKTEENDAKLIKVPSDANCSDSGTKEMYGSKFDRHEDESRGIEYIAGDRD